MNPPIARSFEQAFARMFPAACGALDWRAGRAYVAACKAGEQVAPAASSTDTLPLLPGPACPCRAHLLPRACGPLSPLLPARRLRPPAGASARARACRPGRGYRVQAGGAPALTCPIPTPPARDAGQATAACGKPGIHDAGRPSGPRTGIPRTGIPYTGTPCTDLRCPGRSALDRRARIGSPPGRDPSRIAAVTVVAASSLISLPFNAARPPRRAGANRSAHV